MSLLEVAFKSTVILAVAWVVMLVLRHKSAALRHQVWSLALAAVLVLPFLSTALPAWRIPITNSLPLNSFRFRTEVVAGQTSVQTPLAPAVAWVAGAGNSSLFRTLWLLGAAVSFGQMLVGWIAVERMRRKATPIDLPAFAPLKQVLGITGDVQLRRIPSGSMPVTCGLTQQSILLPSDALNWTEERRRAVLQHELAHVRRHDNVAQLLARFTLVLYWWHPLVWAAWGEFLKERERAADDMVLNLGSNAADYAAHLLDIARSMNAPGAAGWAAIAMARRSQLESRLSAILDSTQDRKSPQRASAVAAFLLTLAVVAPWAALQAQAPATKTVKGQTDSMIARGKTALAAKDYAVATSFFEGALSAEPEETAQAEMWLAITQQRQNNAEGAAASFKIALDAAEPNSPFAATLMELYANLLRESKKDDDASKLMEQANLIRAANAEEARASQIPNPSVHKMSEGTPPVLLSKVEPEYSEDARLAKYSGSALLSIEIGTDGVPSNIIVIRSLALGLDEKAVKAVSQWRFKPAAIDGEPVAVSAQVEINFRLQ